ncbi:MAG TPA: hypothetical protein VG077_15030 [Verrucomicrobiae bacterium]|nr:hypothetical protein [Verrucomicrobiae bacterium]
MKPYYSAVLAVAAASLFINVAKASPVTVLNPSFETLGALTSTGASGPEWNALPVSGGWVSSLNSAYVEYTVNNDVNPSNLHFAVAADGSVVANMGGVGTLSQDLNYAATAGQTITLSFDLGKTLTGLGTGNIEAQILVGGVPIADNATLTATAPAGQWALATITGTASTAGDLSIAFIDINNNSGATPWLDNVSVDASPVPEPSALSFLAFGLIATLFVRRIRLA